MRIRAKELAIPPNDPFHHDLLDRRAIEPILSRFVESGTGPFILGINAPWGTGKTTFLRMWQHALNQHGHHAIYFSAWEVDHAIDPLVPIISNISDQIRDDQGNRSQVVDKIRRVSGAIAKRAIPVAIRLATLGALDVNEVAEATTADMAEALTRDAIDEYERQQSEINEFRELLSGLAEDIRSGQNDQKLVIMVDELDRCRPTFAIELLERIKHLFDIDGLVFVLGMHLEELAHSVEAVYGTNFDARGYLRRFIDFEYQLPDPDVESYTGHLLQHFEAFPERIADTMRVGYKTLTPLISSFFKFTRFSLRRQQQYVARLSVIARTIGPAEKVYEIPLCLLLFIYFQYPKQYPKIQRGSFDFEALLSQWEQDNLRSEVDTRIWSLVVTYMLYAQFEYFGSSNRLSEYLDPGNEVDDEEIKRYVSTMYRGLKESNPSGKRIFQITSRRIDLAENFR